MIVRDCQLEIDKARGVIYVHTADKKAMERFGSATVLRICHCQRPIPTDQMLGITMGHGAN